MARIPTSGATTVTPYRTEAELRKVLKELSPEAEFSASEVKNLYWRLGAIVGRWSAEQSRLKTLSIARRLTAISKNVAAATDTLSAHQTGIQDVRDIEVVSQLKIVLAADPEVGSFEKADELIGLQKDPAKLAEACLIAARNLKKQEGKGGRPPAQWHDDFTALLLDIAKKGDVQPTSWKDSVSDKRRGWLFDAARSLEPFLNPKMVVGGEEATGSRLDRSKERLKQR
ncbi:hypothetical protein JQ597_37305 [Bradyrhizobium sp. AUGA SZCCT0177]|uniref:hypothetical protein n=1 Tax=Bradyrhizobium sp. AUGA SZCCT0177 TaxID=2807665 RepID=UPI001BA9E054|nr:hypothetical protein [Bradyrhizobium sp. AUGA SZCCT0177]MBR1287725.1 hypothetical protein [Bradyrhizobium sp. AUGA SZCCT0177]